MVLGWELEKKRFSITRLKQLRRHPFQRPRRSRLEKKRFSITRLKPGFFMLVSLACYPWKEKILDYEIETCRIAVVSVTLIALEKKRFSITRLKLSSAL